MKKLLTCILSIMAFIFSSCEKKAVSPADLTISFEYREVVNNLHANIKIEIRSTSTPSYVAPYLWYNFGTSHAILIGDDYQYLASPGTYDVKVFYKPAVAPDFDAILASRNFEIKVIGVPDSVWRAAVPVE